MSLSNSSRIIDFDSGIRYDKFHKLNVEFDDFDVGSGSDGDVILMLDLVMDVKFVVVLYNFGG